MATGARDYYATLGVPPDADRDAVHTAFRALARRYHPDRNPSPDAQERFKEIAEAYAVLSDPGRRAAYDRVGAAGPAGADDGDPLAGLGLDDLLARAGMGGFGRGDPLFGGGSYAAGGSFADGGSYADGGPPRASRGADIEVDVAVPLTTVLDGGPAAVTVRRPVRCLGCEGTGITAGTRSHTCSACGGTGRYVVERRRGPLVMRQIATCPACAGTGRTAGPPCRDCGGSGEVAAAESVTLRIPRGVAEGAVLRLRGRGMPAPDANGRPGDAYVTVRTAEDPDFVRLGADLGREVEVTVPDAVLGATLTVPALDGDVPLVVPPGTRSGTVLRVPGRGLPEPGGRARGDLCVSVAVRIPRSLSDRERQLYGALREEAAASAPGEQPAQRPAGDGPAAGSARGRWWPWRRRRTAPR